MTQWSSWSGPSTNRFRVGIDTSVSGTRVSVTYRVECTQSINQEITLVRSGSISGSTSFRMNYGSSGGVTTVGTWSATGSRGNTYYYGARVTGVYNGASPSITGVPATIPALVPTRPGRPSFSNITASSVRVSWSGSSGRGASVSQYQVQFARNSSFSSGVSTGTTSSRTYNATLSDANTTYWVRVRARNSAGWSSWSSSRSFTSRPLRPNAPTNVRASRNSDSSHMIRWYRNASSGRPYGSQRIQRRTFGTSNSWGSWVTVATFTATQTSTGTSTFADRGTRDNRVYQWRVVAVNSAGTATSSSTDAVWTTPWIPGTPTARPSSAGIAVSWQNNVPFGSHDHQIQHRADGGAWSSIAVVPGSVSHHWTTRTWQHQDPDMTVTHQYRIRSRTTESPVLASDWQVSQTLQLAAPPGAPTGLGPGTPWDATEDRSLVWLHVPVDGSDQEYFQVRHRTQGGQWATEDEESSDVPAWVLPAGTYANGDIVEWQVRTWGVHPDPGPWSQTQITQPQARPMVAINTPADEEVIETSRLDLLWGYHQEAGSQQSAWRWWVLEGETEVQARTGTGRAAGFKIRNLQDGATYTVRAQVRSGHGLWSEPVEVSVTVDYMPPDAPSVGVSWDRGLGAAVVQIDQPEWGEEDTAEPDHHLLWRAIDGGQWVLIAADVPLGSAVTDPIPAIGEGRVNHYQATTVSALPSVAHSVTEPLVVERREHRGWVYLNAGPGMATVCRIKDNAERSDTEGLDKTLRQFAGRTRPVEYAGTARSLEWDISAQLAPNVEGASSRQELVDLQALPAPVCYRDPTGQRWFGSMGPLSTSWQRVFGDVSFSMTQVDHVEGLPTDDIIIDAPDEGDDGDEEGPGEDNGNGDGDDQDEQ